MNLYAQRPDAFDADDLADGLVIAAQAALTMAATMELTQLQQAMRSRQLIGEATGMLRERFDLSSDRAFDVLKRLSSQHNVKLFTVAQHVVETGTLPDTNHVAELLGSPDRPTETAQVQLAGAHNSGSAARIGVILHVLEDRPGQRPGMTATRGDDRVLDRSTSPLTCGNVNLNASRCPSIRCLGRPCPTGRPQGWPS